MQIVDQQAQWALRREVRGQPEQTVQNTEPTVADDVLRVRRLEHTSGGLRGAAQEPLATVGIEQQRLEQLTDDAVGQLPFEIASSRAQHVEAGGAGHFARLREELALPDPGRSLDERQDSLARARRLHDAIEALQLVVALEQNLPARGRAPQFLHSCHALTMMPCGASGRL